MTAPSQKLEITGGNEMKPLLLKAVSPALVAWGLILGCTTAIAADEDDVMMVLEKYVALEGDLGAQEELIREDRVMIAAAARQTNQSMNMQYQVAERKAYAEMHGGPSKWLATVESPEIRIYGNTAVASFMRLMLILPPGAEPISPTPQWVTLVLVKEHGNWGIAHTHVSPVTPSTN